MTKLTTKQADAISDAFNDLRMMAQIIEESALNMRRPPGTPPADAEGTGWLLDDSDGDRVCHFAIKQLAAIVDLGQVLKSTKVLA